MKYIHHDTAAMDDEKLAELMMEYGYEGYGLFWAILEKLGKQEKPVKTAVLKKQLHVGKRLEKCWKFLEEIGLINSSDGETFNKQLMNYAGKYQIKKEKNAERISEWRKGQRDTENVTRYTQECNAPVTPPNIIEENRSKEKERDAPPREPFLSRPKHAPTYERALEYFSQQGVPEYTDAFMIENDKTGWTYRDGTEILNWAAWAGGFIKKRNSKLEREAKAEQKKPKQSTYVPTRRDFNNDREWEEHLAEQAKKQQAA